MLLLNYFIRLYSYLTVYHQVTAHSEDRCNLRPTEDIQLGTQH